MKQVIISIFFVIGLIATQLAPPAFAQEQAWLQLESQKSIKDTRDRAQFFAARFPETHAFLTSTGWYAIVVGPFTPDDADRELARLKATGQIPGDSFVTDGTSHISQLWPLSADGTSATASTSDQTDMASDTPTEPEPPALIPDPDIKASRALERGWTRETKKLYQRYMRWTGDYDSAIDGAYGRGTRGAISQFQERNGFEPTGYLTEDQVALLTKRYDDAIARLGAKMVRDLDAGIEVLMPTSFVEFSRFEPPFVHYGAKNGGKVRVMLISQEGDRATLNSLYDIMETFDFVPPEGYRVQKRDWFVLSGRDDNIVSYTYAALDGAILKGFSLIWTPDLDKDMQPFVTDMYDSFAPIQNYVLDETIGHDSGEDGPADLASGLETAEADHAVSGFMVNDAGIVVTHSSEVDDCKRVTLFDGDVNLSLIARNPTLELSVFKPDAAFIPTGYALFSNEDPERGSNVSVAGFSFPEVMEIATLNYGTVTDTDGTLGNPAEIRVSAYLEDGDIGGPVLDDRGAVIGMQMRRDAGAADLPESVNFALKAREITALLKRHDIPFEIATSFDALAAEDISALAGDFTVKISCWR